METPDQFEPQLLSDEELVALHNRAFPEANKGLPTNPELVQELTKARKALAADLSGIVQEVKAGYVQVAEVAELNKDKQAA